MTKVSWLVTLTPLAVALAQTASAAIRGDALTAEEIELIKYLIGAFIGSGAIGAFLSVKKK